MWTKLKQKQEHKSNFDPRKYLKASKEAMRAICIERFEAFDTAGQAARITPLSLEKMTTAYQTGELDPQVQQTSR